MSGVPFAETRWDEIIPNLFQGGHDYAPPGTWVEDVIVRDEFDLVLSFYSRFGHGPDEGVERRYARIPDGVLSVDDLAKVREYADLAEQAVRDGRRVLARCQAGYNRSGLLVAFTLLRLGYGAQDAIDLIRAMRSPYALCNEHFVSLIFAEAIRLDREAVSS